MLRSHSAYLLLILIVLVFHPHPVFSWFDNHTEVSNLSYTGILGERGGAISPQFLDNEGVYVADVTDDYYPDILAVGGTRPVLFRNEGGSFERSKHFPDIDEKINAAVFVDYNRDGRRDLVLIPRRGHVQLLQNTTENGFERDGMLDEPKITAGIGAAAGDLNRDGCPEVLVLQYGQKDYRGIAGYLRYRQGLSYDNFNNDNGEPNFLLWGTCEGFEWDAASTAFSKETHWSLAASIVDLTGNGYQDIHVANDFYRDSIYVNTGDGQFEHRHLSMATNRNGMASEPGDYTHNGRADLFVSNIFLNQLSEFFNFKRFKALQSPSPNGHNLLVNTPNNSFPDRSARYGLQRSGWGWAVSYADFDNSFDFELIQARQDFLSVPSTVQKMKLDKTKLKEFVERYSDLASVPGRKSMPERFQPLWEWMGFPAVWDQPDRKFIRRYSVEEAIGRLNGRGVSSLDTTLDGRLDLVFSQFDGPVKYLKNVTPLDRHWVKFHFDSVYIGGTLTVKLKDRTTTIPVTSRSDFHSQEPATYHIGLRDNQELDSYTMRWNREDKQSGGPVKTGQIVVLEPNEKPTLVDVDSLAPK